MTANQTVQHPERNPLVVQWYPFAYRQAARLCRRCGVRRGTADFEEAVSAAVDGLMEARDRFDDTRGTKYQSYAGWWVLCHLQRWLQRLLRIRNREGFADEHTPEGAAAADAGQNMELEQALECLPRFHGVVIRLRYLSGEKQTLESLAADLGLSAERVRQLEVEAICRLRAQLRDDGPASHRDTSALPGAGREKSAQPAARRARAG
jgi:RNA polymerase sigma factor (sigma-70 family)